jgi:7-cyano-7-deazaguanine reductase
MSRKSIREGNDGARELALANKNSNLRESRGGNAGAGKKFPPLREVTPETHLEIRSTPDEEMKLYPLDTFAYEYVGKRIEIEFTSSEFTAICPFSNFPDFATLQIRYTPNRRCIELKSLKLYINSFREVKIFHEHVVNKILEDFVAACDPLEFHIEGDFNMRGNIKTVVRAGYRKERPKKAPALGRQELKRARRRSVR